MTIQTNFHYFLEARPDHERTDTVVAFNEAFEVLDAVASDSEIDYDSDDSSVHFDFESSFNGESIPSYFNDRFQLIVNRFEESDGTTLPQYQLEELVEQLLLEDNRLEEASNLDEDDDSLVLARRNRDPLRRRREYHDSACLGDLLNLARSRVPLLSEDNPTEGESSDRGEDEHYFPEFVVSLKDCFNEASVPMADPASAGNCRSFLSTKA